MSRCRCNRRRCRTAGALLAYLLARRGVPVTLLERQTDFSREFRGEVLMPSGIAALDEAGLRQQLDALPNLSIRTVEIFRGEQRAVAIPVGGLATSPRIVPQPAMLEMIVGEAAKAKFPGFKLERGVTLRDLIMKKIASWASMPTRSPVRAIIAATS